MKRGCCRSASWSRYATWRAELNARLILIGDPKQHKAVARHGNMLKVLHEYAGLPVVELKEIQRQKGDYAEGVAAIRDEQWEQGDAIFRKLGWIVEGEGHGKLIEEYAKALQELKRVKEDGQWQLVPKTMIVVDPTHKDGDQLSETLRGLRKAEGLIGREEKTFTRLVPLGWTPAEKGDARAATPATRSCSCSATPGRSRQGSGSRRANCCRSCIASTRSIFRCTRKRR